MHVLSGQAYRERASKLRRGVVVGQCRDGKYTMLGGGDHVLVDGPCRSGKGVSVVTPTLLTWPDSAVVLTMRDEAVRLTSGWRVTLGDVYVFDPFEGGCSGSVSHRYNVLNDVRSDHLHEDLRAIAAQIFAHGDPDKWTRQATALFVAAAGYLFAQRDMGSVVLGTARPVTIGEVYRLFSGYGQPIAAWLQAELPRMPDGPHIVEFAHLLALSQKEREDVLTTLLSFLTPWSNPRVDYLTSASDFSMLDAHRRQTVYLCLNVCDRNDSGLMARLVLERLAAREMAGPHTVRCLAMLDAFEALQRWPNYAEYLKTWPKVGVRAVTISQEPTLKRMFGAQAGAIREEHGCAVSLGVAGEADVGDRRMVDRVIIRYPARYEFVKRIRYYVDPLLRQRSTMRPVLAPPIPSSELLADLYPPRNWHAFLADAIGEPAAVHDPIAESVARARTYHPEVRSVDQDLGALARPAASDDFNDEEADAHVERYFSGLDLLEVPLDATTITDAVQAKARVCDLLVDLASARTSRAIRKVVDRAISAHAALGELPCVADESGVWFAADQIASLINCGSHVIWQVCRDRKRGPHPATHVEEWLISEADIYRLLLAVNFSDRPRCGLMRGVDDETRQRAHTRLAALLPEGV
ncbi:hypothetical protein WK76_25035 [Burkholderia ubonensis]|nr:hypothetical protein WK76_25035 [Burkholderia ubonensis]